MTEQHDANMDVLNAEWTADRNWINAGELTIASVLRSSTDEDSQVRVELPSEDIATDIADSHNFRLGYPADQLQGTTLRDVVGLLDGLWQHRPTRFSRDEREAIKYILAKLQPPEAPVCAECGGEKTVIVWNTDEAQGPPQERVPCPECQEVPADAEPEPDINAAPAATGETDAF